MERAAEPRAGSEPATYRTAARGFREGFARLYAEPGAARVAYRSKAALLGLDRADEAVRLTPQALGALRDGVDPAEARRTADLAALYWSRYEERPRVFLQEVAVALRGVSARREYERERDSLGEAAERARLLARRLTEERERARQRAREVWRSAGQIYAEPGRAFRAVWRAVLEWGPSETRQELERAPESFGPLQQEARTRWGVFTVWHTEAARARVPELGASVGWMDSVKRPRTGAVLRARAQEAAAREARGRLNEAEPPDVDERALLREAGAAVARLRARRVRSWPAESRPTVARQLEAMLPPAAAALVDEAVAAAVRAGDIEPDLEHYRRHGRAGAAVSHRVRGGVER